MYPVNRGFNCIPDEKIYEHIKPFKPKHLFRKKSHSFKRFIEVPYFQLNFPEYFMVAMADYGTPEFSVAAIQSPMFKGGQKQCFKFFYNLHVSFQVT